MIKVNEPQSEAWIGTHPDVKEYVEQIEKENVEMRNLLNRISGIWYRFPRCSDLQCRVCIEHAEIRTEIAKYVEA